MYEDKLQLVEHSDHIYAIIDYKTQSILAGNKLCRQLYQDPKTDQFLSLNDIFRDDAHDIDNVAKFFLKVKYMKLLEIKSYNIDGSVYNCDIEIRFFDEENDIVFVVIKPIIVDNELLLRCINLSKQVELDKQYFDVFTEFSKDVLFRLNVKDKTMVHRGDISQFDSMPSVVENYPDSMRHNDIIHPDYIDGYMQFIQDLYSGKSCSYETLVHYGNDSYQHYTIHGKPLFNSNGEVFEVIGKSENTHDIYLANK